MNLSRVEIVGVIVGAFGLLAWVVPFPGYLELHFLGLFALIYLGYRALKRFITAGEHHQRLYQLTLGLFVFGGLATIGTMRLGRITNPFGILVIVLALIYPGYLAIQRRN